MGLAIVKEIFYAAEAASLLNKSVQEVYRLIHNGKLAAYREEGSKTWNIPANSITDYINARHKRGKSV